MENVFIAIISFIPLLGLLGIAFWFRCEWKQEKWATWRAKFPVYVIMCAAFFPFSLVAFWGSKLLCLNWK